MSGAAGAPGVALPALVRALPRRAVSRAVGLLARLPLPRPVLAPAIRLYAWGYGVDLGSAERPPGGYRTFLEFFDRRLRAGLRPPPAEADAIAAPADARVHGSGPIDPDAAIEVKGNRHALCDLLGDPSGEDARAFAGGTWVVLHLSPADYHRFHWPFDAEVTEVRHLPGDLWPVHAGAVAAVPRLFARNERAVLLGRLPAGRRFAVVAVGALDVGSIRLTFHPLRTNRGAPARPRRFPLDPPAITRRGEEMGWFEMGSALVLLLGPGAGGLAAPPPGSRVRVGEALGRSA